MKNKICFAFIILLSLIPVLSLFHTGFPVTHDGQDHVARIANFYLNLTDGNLIPRWAPNLNWGYGHPILEFLYPLPSYIASVFHLLGLSLVNSTKIVFGLGIISSLPFMYLWLSQFVSRYSALFGAILYTYAPYRFVELYVRGDIGENLAFPFIPLVLYFLYKLYKDEKIKYLFFAAFSLAGLVLAHNAISLMVMPFILIYGLLLLCLSKNKRLFFIRLIFLILLGFSLSAFFWIPALLEGKYTLRNIVTAGGYIGRFISLNQIIYGPWNYGGSGVFTVQYGIFQWISIVFSPVVIYVFRKNREKYLLSLILLIFTILSTLMMLQVSEPIWSRIILLQNFQFPWRFLAIIVFSTSVMGALFFELIPKKHNLKLLIIFTLIVLAISSFYWKPKDYQYKSENFYSGIYKSTTDTGESSPIWSVRGMERIPQAPIQIISGVGIVKELTHTSTYRLYSINANTSTRVLVDILYFPDWTIFVDGEKVPVQFQDPKYRGLMTFEVPVGSRKIEAVFKDTKIRAYSNYLSLLTFSLIIIFFGLRFVKRRIY